MGKKFYWCQKSTGAKTSRWPGAEVSRCWNVLIPRDPTPSRMFWTGLLTRDCFSCLHFPAPYFLFNICDCVWKHIVYWKVYQYLIAKFSVTENYLLLSIFWSSFLTYMLGQFLDTRSQALIYVVWKLYLIPYIENAIKLIKKCIINAYESFSFGLYVELIFTILSFFTKKLIPRGLWWFRVSSP